MKTKLILPLVALSLVQCTSHPRQNSVDGRVPSAVVREPDSVMSTTFDAYLQRLGVNVYYANLHAHHYMDYRKTKKSPYPDGYVGPGKCDGMGSFPQDDGRPCRTTASGQNEFILPPSFKDGKVGDKLDYFRMACDYAQSEGALDILIVTPHSKNGGGSGDADTELDGYVSRLKELPGLNKKYDGKFYCGLGQEASSISRGNHVNIMGHMGVSAQGPANPFFFAPGDFTKFYADVKARKAAGERVVLQLNHPDIGDDLYWGSFGDDFKKKKDSKEKLNDYGLDDFAPVACLLPSAGNVPACASTTLEAGARLSNDLLKQTFANIRASGGDYNLIEVVSPGGATSNPDTNFRTSHKRMTDEKAAKFVDRDIQAWIFYLYMGFKVSPTANQDNHHMNFGSATASRTGVLAKSLSEDDVFSALGNRITFATDDKNAKVLLTARVDGKDILMGQDVEVNSDSVLLGTGYSDPDDKGLVDLRVYYYHEGDELSFERNAGPWGAIRTVQFTDEGPVLPSGPAEPIDMKDWLSSGQVRPLRLPVKKGRTIIFVEYTQADRDKVWSAPLFINAL